VVVFAAHVPRVHPVEIIEVAGPHERRASGHDAFPDRRTVGPYAQETFIRD
jgi:hypothetical protein